MAKSEWVDLVDRDNQVVGQAQRHQVRSQNLLHRGIAVWVENSQGQVYVHQRTASKDLFPSLFDMFVGGVVGAGESYEVAAAREAAEELGAAGELEFRFDYLYEGPHNFSWIRAYRMLWDGPIRHQPEEIQWGRWMPIAELDDWVAQVEIVPDGLDVYRAWCSRSR